MNSNPIKVKKWTVWVPEGGRQRASNAKTLRRNVPDMGLQSLEEQGALPAGIRLYKRTEVSSVQQAATGYLLCQGLG